MIIDCHTHLGDLRRADALGRLPVTADSLLERLDEEGIDRAIVLPLWPNPEGIHFPYLFSEQPDMLSQIRTALRTPDRLIPFGNLDPRMGGNTADTDYSWVLQRYVDLGCVGIGEVTANLAADDPRVVNLFRQCGEWALPVLIHSTGPGPGYYGLIDPLGLPNLDRLLQQVPGTTVIAHGPGFWSEIAAGATDETKSGYPTGPVAQEGSMPGLLRRRPNLYVDISAGSGYNALTRDPEYGVRFLHEFGDRILFGTDVCFAGPEDRMPHLGYLRGLRTAAGISADLFERITGGNAQRVLVRLGSRTGAGT